MSSPQFGYDYDIGHIGFTDTGGFVSAGISWFERWERRGPFSVTHTFIVSGANECIEAHLESGVARASLEKYFGDPHCRVSFRRPTGWSRALGERIVTAAAAKIGGRYNTGLILAAAAGDSLLGHWLNRALDCWPNRMLSRLLDRGDHWICSQLVAYALDQQPEFHGRGSLRAPLDTIDPQQLFEDQDLFESPENTLPEVPPPPPSPSLTNPS